MTTKADHVGEIYFDNSVNTYSGGQTVSGRIELRFNEVKTVTGISIEFKGEAHTFWNEAKNATGPKDNAIVTFSDTEEYFNEKCYVVGSAKAHLIDIPAGQHIYPFKYVLPKILPSSFKGDYGYIRYTVKANLDRPQSTDQFISAEFTVETHLDSMEYSSANVPGILTLERYFGFLCCQSGPLTGIVKIPCNKFKTGQIIPATVEIDNASMIAVRGMNIQVNKIEKYRSSYPSNKVKINEIEMAKYNINSPVGPRCSLTMHKNISVPHFQMSNITSCKIMEISYEIKILLDVVANNMNVSGIIPIYPTINK